MKNVSYHDTLFNPHGGPLLDQDAAKITLKKRTSSVVYTPETDAPRSGTLYPRCIVLNHSAEKPGALLATFECRSNDVPVFPIFESLDDGASWHLLSQIEDKERGWGCRYQPHLFELPQKVGDLPAGTILCAGNIIPKDLSATVLHLYQSQDGGKTWSFLSEIISGGVAKTDPPGEPDENRPVWEPFLELTEKGELICFYSDERYLARKKWNQMLAHKVSPDGGKTWGPEVVDIAFADSRLRPGMPIITRMGDGRYVMVYEMVMQDAIPVYFRVSDSIEDWGEPDFMGNPVRCADGRYISGTPYVLWIPQGGEKGTLLASGRGFGHILANSNGGEGPWEVMPSLIESNFSFHASGYSQCLVPLHGGRQILNLCTRQIGPELAQVECAVADVYVKA